MFDVVIPVGPNDIQHIHKHIQYTKQYIIGYRNIYIISCDPNLQVDDCIIIKESDNFPFTIQDIELYIGNISRKNWYYQQLLKLYAGFAIPDILEKYLVIDADTYFIKPTTFINNENKCLYSTGTEYHIPYFAHMKRMHPSLEKMLPNKSGICHHMMFEKCYIEKLFELVSSSHNNTPFWICFLSCVDSNSLDGSGASEYELYFNYMLKYYPTEILYRQLHNSNVQRIQDIENVEQSENNQYDSLSLHWYQAHN